MLVIKICISDWINASRDIRELGVLSELGAKCIVIAKGLPKDKGRETCISGYEAHLYSTKPLGSKRFLNVLNRVLSIFLWAFSVRKYEANILSCHDIGALLIGWLSTLFLNKKKTPFLIYDSHEFEIERYKERSAFNKFVITNLERFLIRKCAFSIMVNDTIADKVQQIHGLGKRPIVVRNTPPFWEICDEVVYNKRLDLLNRMNLPCDSFILMYHGGINKDRGIETLIEIVSKNPNVVGIVLGNGHEMYMDSLMNMVKVKGIDNRILFHPAVQMTELWKYVGAADIGMVLIKNICLNHYFSLPNKLFENIQSMTPIIGSNFPEINHIIEKYKIGLTCNPENIVEINAQVEKMRTNKDFYESCKTNLIKAKQELCWERENQVLKEAYGALMKKVEVK